MSVQNNVKKQDRLELFGVFSDSGTQPQSKGNVWNISENEDGLWNSSGKLLRD